MPRPKIRETAAGSIPTSSATLAGLRVLLVDDPKTPPPARLATLESLACPSVLVASGADAVQAAQHSAFDLAIIEERLSDVSALELLPRLLAVAPSLDVIVVAAQPTVEHAVEALRHGASDYLPSPVPDDDVRRALVRVAERRDARTHGEDLRTWIEQGLPEADLLSESPAMRAVFDIIERAARSDASVLFRGESGTGKSVLARYLHAKSRRAKKPFVVVSCPVLSEDLLASELFGHVAGAFTGATREKLGRVETANGGTLFLDEIGEISPPIQAKLLRFIQDREFERVGESLQHSRKADVRIVAASHRDLSRDVPTGRFREDLLYRLNVIEIEVPALRERREDVLRLARHFVQYFAFKNSRSLRLSARAEKRLQSHSWPGNLRELRNVIERAAVLARGAVIDAEALDLRADRVGEVAVALGGRHTLREIEDAHVRAVVARAQTQIEAAEILGVDPATLWRKGRKTTKLVR